MMGRILRSHHHYQSTRTLKTAYAAATAALFLSSPNSLATSFTPTGTSPSPSFTVCPMSSSSSTSEAAPSSSPTTSTLQIHQFPCLDDNYGYLLHDPTSGATAAIDTPHGPTYASALSEQGWTLTDIWNTHHHWDHTGGNLELKNCANVQICGPAEEAQKIPGLDKPVEGGQTFSFGNSEVQVINVGGHTKGHVAYYLPKEGVVFCGDALFVMGCGRMFEGTEMQFWQSLERLRALPKETKIYCAHEYTLSNAKFALSVEPSNPQLIAKVKEVESKRQDNIPTVPSTIGEELETNPFLRIDVSEELRRNVGVEPGSTLEDSEVFGRVRSAKDNFRG